MPDWTLIINTQGEDGKQRTAEHSHLQGCMRMRSASHPPWPLTLPRKHACNLKTCNSACRRCSSTLVKNSNSEMQ